VLEDGVLTTSLFCNHAKHIDMMRQNHKKVIRAIFYLEFTYFTRPFTCSIVVLAFHRDGVSYDAVCCYAGYNLTEEIFK